MEGLLLPRGQQSEVMLEMVVGAVCLYIFIRLILSLFTVHGSYILLTVAALVQKEEDPP